MGIFFKKWRKWLPSVILTPLTTVFIGAWISPKLTNRLAPVLIAKDAKIYNRLPVTNYGETPWSPMQLDLQQFDVLHGQTVKRIEAANNNIVLYATANDDGANAKWYLQDISKDIEPHQILNDVTNLDWHYNVKIWNNEFIYGTVKHDKYFLVTSIKKKNLVSDIHLIEKYFIWNNYLIYGIRNELKDTWYVYNLNLNKIITSFDLDKSFAPKLSGDKLYYIFNNNLYYLKFNAIKIKKTGLLKNIKNFAVINNHYVLYSDITDTWFLHNDNFGYYEKNDQKIIQVPFLFLKNNKLFFISNFTQQSQIYYLLIYFKGNDPIISKVAILWSNAIFTNLDFQTFNSKLTYFKGNYFFEPTKTYNFIQRWIEPPQDFNLNVAKITGYGNASNQAMIDFNINPNWQNKNYYLANTKYYLHYWVDNKEEVTSAPLKKAGDHYRFTLSNDALINYDGKTLHATLSANVNGREVNNIKLNQANGLFKYDDVNDTYDYNVKNYTPSYWTKARIVGLSVGCVLTIPFLVALFFWLKRQWNKIYF